MVSTTRGLTTGTPSMSAWNCIRKSLTDAPPSTRSSGNAPPASSVMAPSTSAVWCARDSNAALTMCAFVTPRVSPTMAPRAALSQYGAPRPVKAGTM